MKFKQITYLMIVFLLINKSVLNYFIKFWVRNIRFSQMKKILHFDVDFIYKTKK